MYKQVKQLNGQIDPDIILKDDRLWIPNDASNKDWQAYQEWLSQGNQPLEADE